MGVNWPDISFMLAARAQGASFDRTLTIGRQNLFATADGIMRAYRDCSMDGDWLAAKQIVSDGRGYAEPLLRYLGADSVESLDASNYEESTIIHDMNRLLPEALRGRFSLVFDGGSLEHVFNYPQALKNCMDAVGPGGHFMAITPANNLVGHGFYQFSPDLFYRALSPVNGFEIQMMLLRATHRWARWYGVADPKVVGRRVTLTSPWTSLIYLLARKVSDVEPFDQWPQQSDYETAWAGGPHLTSNRIQRLPAPLRQAAKLASVFTGTTSHRGDLRPIDIGHFAKPAPGPKS
jgi:hypothetical protein